MYKYFHCLCFLFVYLCTEIVWADEPLVAEFQGKRGVRQPMSVMADQIQHKTLLIGINDYVEPMSKLTYCIGDVKMLAETFEKTGIDLGNMVLMTDDANLDQYKPNRANIFRQLRTLLRDATENDTVMVVFSGHGLHVDGVSYLCPNDGDPDVPETLISHWDITKIMDSSKAKRKLFFIDACRNTPILKGGRSGPNVSNGFDNAFGTAKGTAFLLSCSEGEVTWEFDELNHGAFSHFIARGLSGAADENEDSQISLAELTRYVSENTKKYVKEKRDRSQTPSFKGDIADSLDNFILTRKENQPKPKTKATWESRAVFGRFGGHIGRINTLTASPIGQVIASGGEDGTARLWESHTGRNVQTFNWKHGEVCSVDFSLDGRFLLTAHGLWNDNGSTTNIGFIEQPNEKGIAILWDVLSGDIVQKFDGSEARILSAKIIPDGRIVTASTDNIVRLWNAETAELIRVFTGSESPICFMMADKDRLDGVNMSGKKITWNLKTGEIEKKSDFPASVMVSFKPGKMDERPFIITSRDGKQLDAFPVQKRLMCGIQREEKIKNEQNLTGNWNIVLAEPSTADCVYVALNSGEKILPSMEAFRFREPFLTYSSVYSPNGEYFYLGHNNGTITRFRSEWIEKDLEGTVIKPDMVMGTLSQSVPNPWSLAISPDGTQLVVAGSLPCLQIFDVASGIERPCIIAGSGNVYAVNYSHDGKRLVCATSGQKVPLHMTKEEAEKWETDNAAKLDEFDITARIYNVLDGRENVVLRGHKNRLLAAAFTSDDAQVLTGSMDRTIRFWDSETGKEKHVIQNDSGITSIDILQDGKHFVTGHADGTICLWDLEKKTLLRSMKENNGIIWQVSASPNGRFLLSNGFNNSTKLWNLETTEIIRQIGEHSGTEAAIFSPDGKYYLITKSNGNASLRLLANDIQVAEFGLGQNNTVRAFVFTPDGQNIVTSFWNGEVVLWE